MRWRKITDRIAVALSDTPVVLINGARQTGKTTLVRSLVRERVDARYFSLDDAAVLAAAAGDPTGFVAAGDGLVVIDEVQKVPDLLPAIKLAVDRDRRPGRFLLTGSAHVLTLPRISESLAGRIEILTLWPFSQGEIAGTPEGFVDAVFSSDPPRLGDEPPGSPDLRTRVVLGGFPEVLERADEDRRRAWFASYVSTILQRDVRDLANIESLTDMPRLLSLLASRVSGLMNKAEISRDADIAYATLDRYLALLQMTFLFQPLAAWSGNLGKRLTKAPKVHLCDSGLAAHLMGMIGGRPRDPTTIGPLIESFVAMELRKQASWARTQVSLYHFRTAARREVDLMLEDGAGRVVAIEVKASATFGKRDIGGLRSLAHDLGKRFHRGVLLYGGETVVPLGDRLQAMPISALWRWSIAGASGSNV